MFEFGARFLSGSAVQRIAQDSGVPLGFYSEICSGPDLSYGYGMSSLLVSSRYWLKLYYSLGIAIISGDQVFDNRNDRVQGTVQKKTRLRNPITIS